MDNNSNRTWIRVTDAYCKRKALCGEVTAILLKGNILGDDEEAFVERTAMVRETIRLFHEIQDLREELGSFQPWSVVCSIVNACYCWKIADSSVAADCLTIAEEASIDFKYTFDVFERPHREWVGGGSLMREYYFEHASRAFLMFEGRRFVDHVACRTTGETFLGVAIRNVNAELLLLVCRYGAKPELSPGNSTTSSIVIGLRKLLYKVWERHDQPNFRYHQDSAARCVEILLRYLPQLAPWSLHYHRYPPTCLFEFERFIPSLQNHNAGVSSLKHAARCRIRRALNDCWQLPHGIERLTLPITLYHYLDLAE